MSTDFFDDERYWLEKQPEMQPWKKGCERLAEKLERHIDTILNGKRVPYRSGFLPRVWLCIAYHWKHAAGVDDVAKTVEKSVPVEEVLDGLAQKKSFDPKKKTLGGNPIPDMAYAVHYVKKDGDAMLRMNSEYEKYCRGVVSQREDMLNSYEEWWNMLMCELGVFEQENHEKHATIYRYFGWDHLRSWLAKAVYNHARCFLRRMRRYALPQCQQDDERDVLSEIAGDEHTPVELAILIENGNETDQERLLRIIPQALEELPKLEKLAIMNHYYDNMTLEQIGGILGIHKGNVSKRLKVIRGKLCDILWKLVRQEKSQPKTNNV